MCTVSMIGDHYSEKWRDRWPNVNNFTAPFVGVSQAEFDELKREVAEMKALLIRAKKYDEDNGEPECEVEAKMAMLRKMAEIVGIDLDDVIGSAP